MQNVGDDYLGIRYKILYAPLYLKTAMMRERTTPCT